jgi:transposase
MQKLTVQNKKRIKRDIDAYLQSNPEARFIHRLHAILLLIDSEDNNCSNLGRLFNNSPRSLSNWVHKMNQTGNIEVLRDKPKPGRQQRLTEQQIKEVKQVLQQKPENKGIRVKAWNGRALSLYIEREFGITLQIRQCQRLMKELKK